MRRSLLVALLLLPALCPPVLAGVTHVPNDVPDLQAAIDAAQPGDTILLDGDSSHYFRITIDKPLTLIGVGSQRPIVLPDGPGPVASSPVTLAGPGFGTVTLVNVWIGGSCDGSFYTACDPSISGGGFDRLRILDSLVEGAPWDFAFHEVLPGAHGIEVDVPVVWIERSTVRGANADTQFDHNPFQQGAHAGHAILASGTVVVLDSSVKGGSGLTLAYDNGGLGGCPTVCPGGDGGHGVVAQRLVRANSTIQGGVATSWRDELSFVGCCAGTPGTAVTVALDETLNDHLQVSGPAHAGGSFTLTCTAPGPSVLLFLAAQVDQSHQLGSQNLFLVPPLVFAGALPSPVAGPVAVPADPALIGVSFGLQGYSSAGWTRPVSGVVAP